MLSLVDLVFAICSNMIILGGCTLLYFAHTCIRGLFIGGGLLPCKKDYKVMVFYCKEPENIICDGISHVNMFHYSKIPYIICT